MTNKLFNKQVSCGITHTNDEVHKLISKNISQSAMYSGSIKGVGPRYCPSIEDKIVKFKDKQHHQIFQVLLEPSLDHCQSNKSYPRTRARALRQS